MAWHRLWRRDYDALITALAVDCDNDTACPFQLATPDPDQPSAKLAAVHRHHDRHLYRFDDLAVGAARSGHQPGTEWHLAHGPHDHRKFVAWLDRFARGVALAMDCEFVQKLCDQAASWQS